MSRGAWLGVFLGVIALGLALAVLTALATGESSTTTSAGTPPSAAGQFDLPLALRSGVPLAQHRETSWWGLPHNRAGRRDRGGSRRRPRGRGRRAHHARRTRRAVRVVRAGLLTRHCSGTGWADKGACRPGRDRRRSPSRSRHGSPRRARETSPARGERWPRALVPFHGAAQLRPRRDRTGLDVQAPDRLSLHTSTGFRSVIIGDTRWDFLEGPGIARAPASTSARCSCGTRRAHRGS